MSGPCLDLNSNKPAGKKFFWENGKFKDWVLDYLKVLMIILGIMKLWLCNKTCIFLEMHT